MITMVISVVSFVLLAIIAGMLRGVGTKIFEAVWKKRK